METERSARMPDILLERYLADDLPEAQRRAVEQSRDSSEEVRARLEALRRERDEFLAVDPPQQFAHRLATRLAVEQEPAAAAAGKRKLWAWILGPSMAAAATAVVILSVVSTTQRATDEQPSRTGAPGSVLPVEATEGEADDDASEPARDVFKSPTAEPALTPRPGTRQAGSAKKRRPRKPAMLAPQAPRSEPAPPAADVGTTRLDNLQESKDEADVGFLTLRCRPWANVYIDGKLYGPSPLFKTGLPPGKHVLRLVNVQLGIDVTRTLIIESGKTLKLNLELSKR